MSGGIVETLRFNAWANHELFHACRSLTDEQLDAQVPGVSGTVRVLLMHIAGGQETLILRTKGRQNERELGRWSDWPGMDAVIDVAERSSADLVAAAESLSGDEQVEFLYNGAVYRYPTRFFLTHAVAHGAEHRTEVKVALGHLGIETPDLDGWRYADAAGYGAETTSPAT